MSESLRDIIDKLRKDPPIFTRKQVEQVREAIRSGWSRKELTPEVLGIIIEAVKSPEVQATMQKKCRFPWCDRKIINNIPRQFCAVHTRLTRGEMVDPEDGTHVWDKPAYNSRFDTDEEALLIALGCEDGGIAMEVRVEGEYRIRTGWCGQAHTPDLVVPDGPVEYLFWWVGDKPTVNEFREAANGS